MLSDHDKRSLSGIGGWLLLFCVILTFIVPISIVYEMIPVLRSGVAVVDLIYALVYLVLALFSLAAGISLWRVRPSAVVTARLFLLAEAAYAVALYVKVLLASAGNTADSAQSLVVGILLRPLLFAVVWYAYLTKSKRVQATYPLDYSAVRKNL